MSLLKEQIEECIENQRFVDIYRGRLCEDETLFGKIINVSNELVAMVTFNADFYDGISVIRIEDITRLRWGGNDRISQETVIKRNSLNLQIPPIDITSFQIAIDDLNETFDYVTIHTEEIDDDICFIGKVKQSDYDYVQLHEFGTMDNLDRSFLTLPWRDITRIEADSKYERDLMYVHSKKKEILSSE